MISKLSLLTGLSLIPLATSSNLEAISKVKIKQTLNVVSEKEPEACTFMYVGKDASKDGRAYVARSGDAGPRAMNMNVEIFEHNQLAGQTVKGRNGFEWKMPDTTYKYIATPKNKSVNVEHWEISGINENGVAVSATLTCGSNDIAKSFDPLVANGISEDNITQIVAATAKTAQEGIQTVANIVDTIGNGEENAIMVMDKNEAWYMELYTGKQYVAVQMPTDKVCTIGNEYMLDDLSLYTKVITSQDYYNLPQQKGFAKYIEGKEHEKKNLDLFHTYASPLTYQKEGKTYDTDSCHMRTWRGLNLFSKNNSAAYQEYKPDVKYPAFFTPDNKLGIEDVMLFMRDRFGNLVTDKSDKNYNYFHEKYVNNDLRYVADEAAYQVHIMTINPNLPAETSIEEWMCLSNSQYSPFVPFYNGLTDLSEPYKHVTPYYGYDEKSAICLYKRLNTLAAQNHDLYGKPVQNCIVEHEQVWMNYSNQILNKIKDLDVNKQKEVMTNFSKWLQLQALELSKMLYEDLQWHIMNITKSRNPEFTKFRPFVNIKDYSYLYGWDYAVNGNIVTLTQGDKTITIDMNYKYGDKHQGKITSAGGTTEDCYVQIKQGVNYIDWTVAKKYMALTSEPRTLNIADFYNKPISMLYWLIPVCVGAPLLIAAITIPLCLSKKYKKTNTKSK